MSDSRPCADSDAEAPGTPPPGDAGPAPAPLEKQKKRAAANTIQHSAAAVAAAAAAKDAAADGFQVRVFDRSTDYFPDCSIDVAAPAAGESSCLGAPSPLLPAYVEVRGLLRHTVAGQSPQCAQFKDPPTRLHLVRS